MTPSSTQPSTSRDARRWGARPLVGAFVAAAIAIAAAAVLATVVYDRDAERAAGETLSATVQLQSSLLARTLDERLADAKVLALRPVSWSTASPTSSPEMRRMSAHGLALATEQVRTTYGYKQIALVDAALRLLAPDTMQLEPDELEFLSHVRDGRSALVSKFRLDEAGGLEFAVGAPVFVDGDSTKAVVGVVYLVQDAASKLLPLLQQVPGKYRGVESVLSQRFGDSITLVGASGAGSALKPLERREALADQRVLAARLELSDDNRATRARDYRGVAVLGAGARVPGEPWMVIAKIELQALKESQRAFTIAAVLIAVAFIALSGLLLRVLWMRAERRATEGQLVLASRYLVATTSSIDGYARLSRSGRFLDVNAALERMTGFSRERLLTRSLEDMKVGLSPEETRDWLAHLMASGSTRFQSQWRRADGTLLDIDVSATALEGDEAGELFCFIRDITEQIRLTTRLERLNALYAFLNHASEALFATTSVQQAYEAVCGSAVEDGGFSLAWVGTVDDETGIVRPVAWSGSAGGYLKQLHVTLDPSLPTSEGPVGRCMREARIVVVNDFAHDAQTQPWHALAGEHGLGAAASFPVILDGRVVAAATFYASAPGYFDAELTGMLGEISRLLGLVMQSATTEQRRREEAERRRVSEERFRQLFESSPMPMYVQHELTGKIARVNRAFVDLFGYTIDDIPTTVEQMQSFYPDPAYRAELAAVWARNLRDATLADAPVKSPDLRIRCKDGSYRSVQGFVSRVADELILGWVDMTEFRASQEMLQDAEEIARLGSWSVDLRTNEVHTSPDFLRVLGFDERVRDEHADQHVPWMMNLCHADDLPRMMAAFEHAAEVNAVIRAATPDDERRYLRVRVRVEREGTEPVRAIGSMQDVTDEVLATAELSRLRDHLQDVVDERTYELARANAALQITDKRLKAMLEMSQKAATLDEADILQLGIDESTKLTGSTIGYLHIISGDQERIEYSTWATGTEALCSSAQATHDPVGTAGLWADAVRRREPVLHNDFANATTRAGYPTGHVPLSRHLVVPVLEGDRVRMLLGVGNKVAEYDQSDVQELMLVGNDIWSVVQRRRADVALERAYDRVRASDERFAVAMEASSEGVWEWSVLDGSISFNAPYATMLGYAPSEMARTIGDWVKLLHPDNADRVGGELLGSLAADLPYTNEFRLRAKDGSYRWVLTRGRVVERDSQGRALRAVGTHTDLTARREAENAMRAARDAADSANRAKSAFLAVMSHEIRTPLNGVIAMAEILAQSPLPADDMDAVQTIRSSANSLLAVIDDVLDFSKIEAGRMDIDLVEMSARQLTEDLCESLLPVARHRGVDLHLFVAPDVPRLVRGDPTRVRQILYNLAGNAIKFSAGRKDVRGRVALRVEPVPGASSQLEFNVSDNGIGMSDDTIGRLFTSFTQAEVSTTRKFGGTGLGLAITKRLTDMMGGRVDVRSVAGQGSTFTVVLPLDAIDARPAEIPHDLHGVRCVVLADSDRMPVDDVERLLVFAGASVTRAANAAAAAAAATANGQPRVIVHLLDNASAFIDPVFVPVHDLRHVLLTRGRRGGPRIQQPNVVTIDSDLLRARRIIRAVAVAAGRASPDVFYDTDDSTAIAPVERRAPMTVDEARTLGRLILVAEDDSTNRKVILRQLELLGHAAEVAEDGAQALMMWRHGTYALLFTDLHMPEMDGYTLTQAIRAEEPSGTRLPIVALTANALRGETVRAEAIGMDGYLTKPVPLDTLRELVDRYVVPRDEQRAVPAPRASGATDRSILQVSVLAELLGDDPTVVREFLAEFQESARTLALGMRRAIVGEDLARVASLAHRLKSSARAVGALPLGDLCADLERVGLLGRADLVANALDACEAMRGRVDAAITAYLATE